MDSWYKLPTEVALFVLEHNIYIENMIINSNGAYYPTDINFDEIIEIYNKQKKVITSTRTKSINVERCKHSCDNFLSDFVIIDKSEVHDVNV